jgi:hypothetical protein
MCPIELGIRSGERPSARVLMISWFFSSENKDLEYLLKIRLIGAAEPFLVLARSHVASL